MTERGIASLLEAFLIHLILILITDALWKTKNGKLFTNVLKMFHFYCAKGHESWGWRTWKVIFHISYFHFIFHSIFQRTNFPTALTLSRLSRIERNDKVDFACASEGKGPVGTATTHLSQVTCANIKKPSDARLCNQANITEQDVSKRLTIDMRFGRFLPAPL